MRAISETNFHFPGQVGEKYQGKVGDVYTIDHEIGELLAVVRTDRLSAFDVVLPQAIPDKGQVLNEMSAALLQSTEQVAPNWLIDVPDPNVSLGFKANPFKLEMIMRGAIMGSAWKAYREEGQRTFGTATLPDTMEEFDTFEHAVLTPTTKAEEGHDEAISMGEIVEQGLATEAQLEEMHRLSVALFGEGQRIAETRGLFLADTKFEFGTLADGSIVVIDEVLTPDSSRYFSLEEYQRYLMGQSTERPTQLSKEFVREWLKTQGFDGSEGQTPPEMPLEFIAEVSIRYQELYEKMLGKPFRPVRFGDAGLRAAELKERVVTSLETLDSFIK